MKTGPFKHETIGFMIMICLTVWAIYLVGNLK